MKRLLMLLVLFCSLSSASKAHAQWQVNDAAAITQRLATFVQYVIQFNQMINGVQAQVSAFRQVYQGLKDWRNLGWVDLVHVVDLPWFDGVDGIDNIRKDVYLTVMSAEQASGLWTNITSADRWKGNPRYRTDPWFRHQVDLLTKSSKRANATRAALLRQMQMQNKAVTQDVAKIKNLRDAIEAENKKQPVNQGTISSLQAEIAAVEARYKGEELILANQRAITFLVGEDQAQTAYIEARDRSWQTQNNKTIRALGAEMMR